METSENPSRSYPTQMLLPGVIPVLSTRGQDPTETVIPPICPDTSLPWSADYALGGWSARMFLHQLLTTTQSHWSTWDTERLLSERTPLRFRANLGKGISLSEFVMPPDTAWFGCFRTAHMVRGLIRRALARGRSFRLLLRTEQDTIPVIVTFGSQAVDSESWTLKSGKPLPDSLANGLLENLKQHAPECMETRCIQK